MPSTNVKNLPISPAASDLGLGDQLIQQIQDDDEERKKRLLAQANQAAGQGPGSLAMSPAVASLMSGRVSGI
jgi:hypothetical protein